MLQLLLLGRFTEMKKEDRSWFVANDRGQIAGHDLTKEKAQDLAEKLKEKEPSVGWEAMSSYD